MDERRRSLRTELHAELLMKRLDRETGEKTEIRVCDLSKSGLGFICANELEKGAMYECFLTIWTQEVIRCFIEIVRCDKVEDGYRYGASFVGMTEMDAYRIEVYQTVEEYKEH